jgi:RHS repeat-associated protein
MHRPSQPGKGSAGSGRRVVDVNLDGGALELDNYDINAAVGPLAADVRSFTLPVDDGMLEIALVASVDKPLLNAIEVLREPDPPSGLNTRTITYTYDGLLRLTDAVYSTGATYGYGYDLAGNRTRVTANGSTTTYAFDAANQVVGWQYDAAGNLLNDGANSYTYDALGRLTRQNQTTYRYNGDGVLSSVTANTTTLAYTQDLAAPLSQVLMVGGEVVVYGRERLFTAHPQGLNWQVHDGLGSLRQILDGSGTTTNRADYDPWGQPQGSASSSFGFTGEVQADNGLTYLRARWYHPGQGTLLGRDPFEGFADQPYSQQYYQYAYSNPVNWTDPSGKTPWDPSPAEGIWIHTLIETTFVAGGPNRSAELEIAGASRNNRGVREGYADMVDFAQEEVYEIKHDGSSENAYGQAVHYAQALHRVDGGDWKPGTSFLSTDWTDFGLWPYGIDQGYKPTALRQMYKIQVRRARNGEILYRGRRVDDRNDYERALGAYNPKLIDEKLQEYYGDRDKDWRISDNNPRGRAMAYPFAPPLQVPNCKVFLDNGDCLETYKPGEFGYDWSQSPTPLFAWPSIPYWLITCVPFLLPSPQMTPSM